MAILLTDIDIDTALINLVYDAAVAQLPAPVVATGVQGHWVRNLRELRSHIAALPTQLVAFFQPAATTSVPGITVYEPSAHHQAGPSGVLVAAGDIQFDGEDYDGMIAVVGGDSVLTIVTQLLYSNDLTCQLVPVQVWDVKRVGVPGAMSGGSIVPVEPVVYAVKDDDWPEFICDTTINMVSKVLSGFLFHYVQTHKYIYDTCQVTDYPPTGTFTPPAGIPPMVLKMISTALPVMTPAFRREGKVAPQMYRRMSAAATAGGFVDITQDQVVAVIQASGWLVNIECRLFPELIGNTVAVDSNGDYNPEVDTIDLMPLPDMAEKYSIQPWGLALLEQCRLIYSKFQSTSLGFGHSVMKLAEGIFLALGAEWATEAKRMTDLDQLIDSCRYLGCRTLIPEAHQIATMPRIIYTGARYYQLNLSTEEAKQEFTHYNIEGIRKHVDPPSAATVCDTIAAHLPGGIVISLGTLIGSLSLREAESYMAGKDETVVSGVHYYLEQSGIDCAWLEERRMQEKRAIMDQMETKLLETIEALYQRTKDALYESFAIELDPVIKQAKQADLENFRRRYVASRESAEGYLDILPPETSEMRDSIRTHLLKKHRSSYYAAAHRATPQPPGSPPREAPPQGRPPQRREPSRGALPSTPLPSALERRAPAQGQTEEEQMAAAIERRDRRAREELAADLSRQQEDRRRPQSAGDDEVGSDQQ
nr:MAG: hypothetical protein [Wufeng shrew peropuvirus 1]